MIQGSEIFVILLLALVVLGPQRLPEIARKLGRWSAELRRTASELRAGLEAEVGDLRTVQNDLQQVQKQLSAPLDEVSSAFREAASSADEVTGSIRWIGPKPHSGPTPEDAMADLAEIEGTGQALTDGEPVLDEPVSPGDPPEESG